MKLHDQVCTLGQAKRLKELGVTQEGNFAWKHEFCTCKKVEKRHDEWDMTLIDKGTIYPIDKLSENNCPHWIAFTVAELGAMLPAGYDTMYCTGEGWRGYDMDGNDIFEPLPTEAQTRAAMLIHVLETGEFTADEVNKRLTA